MYILESDSIGYLQPVYTTMFDLKTLMFSLFIVQVLLAGMMVGTWRMQKTYPGFDTWCYSLGTMAVANICLMLRGVIPDILSILGGNVLLILSLLLMADSLHRFFTATPLIWKYYLILIPYSLLNIVYTVISNNLPLRGFYFSVFSILTILGIIWIIHKKDPERGTLSLLMIFSFGFLAIVMAFRGLDLLLTPVGRNFFENSPLNGGTYLVGIITLISITFLYLNLNFHRLAGDLLKSKATADQLLFDLDMRNRDLEQVSMSLWTLNNDLDLKVKERTQKIENLLFQKDQFIHQIGHDLRTPLTPLVALVPLVKQMVSDPDGEKMLDLIDKNVQHLRDMTEQIVRLANLNNQSSVTDYHLISVAELIQDSLRINAVPIQNRNISVETSIPLHLTVCVSKVFGTSIFSNIINNAVKYNNPSGKIVITAAEEDTTVLISIADTGVGISADTLDKIWDELFICDSSRNDPLSKGLGLSMVRKIVTLHGGEITASSPGIGMGSVFVIRLPQKCPDEYDEKITPIA